MDLENVAYSDDYLAYREQYTRVFGPDFFQEEETIILSYKYTLIKRCYFGQFEHYFIRATENDLVNENGEKLYTYRNLNDDAEFCTIINHKNGNQYMVFRSELYGYSVLDLSSLEDFHYFPRESLRRLQGDTSAEETFIWVQVHYNKINNILAVEGCYWACPMSILLIDFSEPMISQKSLIEIEEKNPNAYAKIGDIGFEAWDGTDLVLCSLFYEPEKNKRFIIQECEYLPWF